MSNEIQKAPPAGHDSSFERIRRTNAAGTEYWSSRDFANVLGYSDYRNFEQVIQKARLACFNSGQRIEDHFVEITEMIEIGKGGQRADQVYWKPIIASLKRLRRQGVFMRAGERVTEKQLTFQKCPTIMI